MQVARAIRESLPTAQITLLASQVGDQPVQPVEALVHELGGVALLGVAGVDLARRLDGQVAAFFVMVVAAAEVVVGLAIIMTIFRTRRSASVDDASLLKL